MAKGKYKVGLVGCGPRQPAHVDALQRMPEVDVVACADFVVDLGPEGGDAGGLVIATGTPEEVAQSPDSETGAFLKRKLSERTKQTKRAKKQPRKR